MPLLIAMRTLPGVTTPFLSNSNVRVTGVAWLSVIVNNAPSAIWLPLARRHSNDRAGIELVDRRRRFRSSPRRGHSHRYLDSAGGEFPVPH